ncbi:MAG: ATP-binding cassette domain-containing protein, partial [Pseudacidovorax sp.]|nr:ATP-binding cassette domain-containing protein [Pseudacidovorax sp.]
MSTAIAEAPAATRAGVALPEGRVLQVDDLSVRFATRERTVDAVKHLGFHVDRGETLAIVGESGSGKSVTSLALMRLVDYGGGRILNGRMALRRRSGEVLDLAQASQATMRGIRGSDVAMIFQEPMTSLNPVFTAGDQIAEAIAIHQGKSQAAARAEALRMLELVRIPEARGVLRRREDGVGTAGFDLVAAVHHQHAVGDLGHHAHVVRDEEHAHVHLLLQLADELE